MEKKYETNLAKYQEDLKTMEKNHREELGKITKEQARLETLRINLDLKKSIISVGEKENARQAEKNKQLEDDINQRQAKLDENIKTFEENTKIQEEQMRLWESALRVAKNSLNEEKNDFEQEVEMVQSVLSLWDTKEFEKEQLSKSFEQLQKDRANIDAQLKSEIDKSKNVQKRLDDELKKAQNQASQNAVSF